MKHWSALHRIATEWERIKVEQKIKQTECHPSNGSGNLLSTGSENGNMLSGMKCCTKAEEGGKTVLEKGSSLILLSLLFFSLLTSAKGPLIVLPEISGTPIFAHRFISYWHAEKFTLKSDWTGARPLHLISREAFEKCVLNTIYPGSWVLRDGDCTWHGYRFLRRSREPGILGKWPTFQA